MTTQTAAYFCPECGSPSITSSPLANTTSNCRACGWSGATERLAVIPISHTFGNTTELLTSMVGDLRTLLSKDVGVHMARFLQRWGFISLEGEERAIAGKKVGRYLAAIARSIVVSLIEERDKMEVERARGS